MCVPGSKDEVSKIRETSYRTFLLHSPCQLGPASPFEKTWSKLSLATVQFQEAPSWNLTFWRGVNLMVCLLFESTSIVQDDAREGSIAPLAPYETRPSYTQLDAKNSLGRYECCAGTG